MNTACLGTSMRNRFTERARRNALMPPVLATAMRIPNGVSTFGGNAA